MYCIRKSIFSFLCTGILITKLAAETPLTYRQAMQNINHVIDALCIASAPANHALETELYALKYELVRKILGNIVSGYFYSYSSDKLYEAIIGGVIDYIQRKSIEHAQALCSTMSIPAHIDRNQMITAISKKITNEALGVTTKYADLNGKFAPYIGIALKVKVQQLLHNELMPYVSPPQQPVGPQHCYDWNEQECKNCFEEFGTPGHERIILACKHSLCRTCVFLIAKHSGRCLGCNRSTVNITQLQAQLAASPVLPSR